MAKATKATSTSTNVVPTAPEKAVGGPAVSNFLTENAEWFDLDLFVPVTAASVVHAHKIAVKRGGHLSAAEKIEAVQIFLQDHMSPEKVAAVIAKSDDMAKRAIAAVAAEKARAQFNTIAAGYSENALKLATRRAAVTAELAKLDASILATRQELASKIGCDVENVILGTEGFLYTEKQKKNRKLADGDTRTRAAVLRDYSEAAAGYKLAKAKLGGIAFTDLVAKSADCDEHGKGNWTVTANVGTTEYNAAGTSISTAVNALCKSAGNPNGCSVNGPTLFRVPVLGE